MIKLRSILFENLVDREKNIQLWLDDLFDKAPGKDSEEAEQIFHGGQRRIAVYIYNKK